MYLDSDTKVIISGVFMILAGLVVWKKTKFLYCSGVLCFIYQSVYDVFSDSCGVILEGASKLFLFYFSCYQCFYCCVFS